MTSRHESRVLLFRHAVHRLGRRLSDLLERRSDRSRDDHRGRDPSPLKGYMA